MFAVLLAGPLPALASTQTSAEADLVSRINAERTSRGLPALELRSDLRDVARRQAERMADRGRMYHNPNLRGEVCCWRKVGENVGKGSDTATIHRMMMDSSSHRANILDADFIQLGVGVERRGGTIWVSEVFRLPDDVPEPEPEPPPPPPEPEPEAQPEPPPPSVAPTDEPVTPHRMEQSEAPAPEPNPPEAPRPCEDATSVALARALSSQTRVPIGEVLATLCPDNPRSSVGLQR